MLGDDILTVSEIPFEETTEKMRYFVGTSSHYRTNTADTFSLITQVTFTNKSLVQYPENLLKCGWSKGARIDLDTVVIEVIDLGIDVSWVCKGDGSCTVTVKQFLSNGRLTFSMEFTCDQALMRKYVNCGVVLRRVANITSSRRTLLAKVSGLKLISLPYAPGADTEDPDGHAVALATHKGCVWTLSEGVVCNSLIDTQNTKGVSLFVWDPEIIGFTGHMYEHIRKEILKDSLEREYNLTRQVRTITGVRSGEDTTVVTLSNGRHEALCLYDLSENEVENLRRYVGSKVVICTC